MSIKLSGEQPPSDYSRLQDWLNRMVSQINGSIEQANYPYDLVRVVSARSTFGNQVLICKNNTPISITLQVLPPIGTNVHIKRRDAQVTVVGDIDGVANKVISSVNQSLHLYYDGIDWNEI